jgi:hypothetical protein
MRAGDNCLRQAPEALLVMLRATICAAALLVVGLLGGCSQRSNEATAPTAPTANPAVITVGWVGDTVPGSRYGMPPRRGRALFERVRSATQAPDIMVGNLEGTFGQGGSSERDSAISYSFQAPPPNAKALTWAGFDVMSVANNHANDFSATGMESTRRALKSAGIAYTGLPSQITVVKRRGVRVAFIGVAPYGWSQSLADVSGTARLVRKARSKADVVIVLMHAGAEGAREVHTPKGAERAYGEFRGAPREFAHAMIDAGASAVFGSGPHVVRGVERYKGRLIAYSLGNFAAWQTFNTSGVQALSGLLTVRIDSKGKVLDGQWLSLKLTDSGVPTIDSTHGSATLVRKLSRQDFRDAWPLSASTRSAGR